MLLLGKHSDHDFLGCASDLYLDLSYAFHHCVWATAQFCAEIATRWRWAKVNFVITWCTPIKKKKNSVFIFILCSPLYFSVQFISVLIVVTCFSLPCCIHYPGLPSVYVSVVRWFGYTQLWKICCSVLSFVENVTPQRLQPDFHEVIIL